LVAPQAGFDWAHRFDDAARAALEGQPGDLPALERHADFKHAAPTPDHFIPALYLAGLAAAAKCPAQVLVDGYAFGSLSMTSYTLAADCAKQATGNGPSADLPDPAVLPPEDTNI
jgi:4,5-DOPA dioxygenase extradiol